MKTSLFAKRSIIVTVALAAAMAPTFALSATGSLGLSGVVSPVTTITVTADANATALPVGSAATDLKIATVTELSNSKSGYTVTLSTTNGAKLKGSVDFLAYTLKYGSNAVSFIGGTATLTTASTRSASSAGSANILYISFPATYLSADTYIDSLTFTISSP